MVTSGDLCHSSIKNMQIVMSDFFFFLCQLFLPDPITVQLSRHLPVHQVTKYKQTDHAIVVRADTIVHTLLQWFLAKTLNI